MCPYADKYVEVLEELKEDYEFILWNRKNVPITSRYKNVSFVYESDIYKSKQKKVIGFIKYHNFVKKRIKQKKYTKLIFLTTLSAVICGRKILKQYENRYIFDFRDLSYEKNKIFYCLVKEIIEKSYFTCISSSGFLDVLPKHKYVLAHNFRYDDLNAGSHKGKKEDGAINILQIGVTRGEEFNLKLCKMFGDDLRFHLSIIGSGCNTKKVVETAKNYSNITIKGEYMNIEKRAYINNADMLMYYYPCNYNCDRALANKYYDGLIYMLPLIGNAQTFSGKLLQSNQLGISINNVEAKYLDTIYDYYKSLDYKKFTGNCMSVLNKIIEEDKEYMNRIRGFLNERE